MVGEGIEPASIEQAAAQAGYPAKVLSLMDELTLTLPRKIRNETRRAVEEAGGTWPAHPADAVIDRMVDEFGRTGRSGGAGFYDYAEDGKRAGCGRGCASTSARRRRGIPFEDMQERMLFAEALDTVRCLEEGVLTSRRRRQHRLDPRHRLPRLDRRRAPVHQRLPGRPARLRRPRPRTGRPLRPRFEPPALLLEKAASGEQFS